MITLDNNWRIDKDNTHGFRLIFEQEVSRQKINNKTKEKLDEWHTVTDKEVFYYPTVRMALSRYFDKNLEKANGLEEIKEVCERVDELYNKISKLKV